MLAGYAGVSMVRFSEKCSDKRWHVWPCFDARTTRFDVNKVCIVWCVLAALLVGCEKSQDAKTEPAKDAVAAADVPAQEVKEPEEKAPEVKEPDVLDEELAKEVVSTWLAAQNEGDFAKYSAQYASRFMGVKRVGPRRFRYDRAGWVKDRERMFKKPMKVELTDMEFVPGTRSVAVNVTQTWSSGTYKDVGPKQLVLVQEGDDLKIAREEMLESNILEGKERVPRLETGAVGFSVGDKFSDIMVFPVSVKPDWFDANKAKGLSRGDSAWAPLKDSIKSSKFKDLVGAKVVVGKGSKTCETEIKDVIVVGEAVPHFGQRQWWDGSDVYDDAKRLPDDEVARELMAIAEGQGTYLGVKLEPSCESWDWGALKPDDGKLEFAKFTPLAEDDALRGEISEAFRALPAHKAIQKDYDSMEEGKSSTVWSGKAETLTMKRATFNGREFVYVGADVGHGCDAFLGQLWAVYEVGSDTILMTDGKNPGEYLELDVVTDLNGDEAVDFVSGKGFVVQSTGQLWRTTHKREVPFFDCPC